MQRLIQWRACDAALGLIVLSALVYGAFGYPTPDHMRGVEWAIAALLILAFFLSHPWHIFDLRDAKAGKIFFVFGLSVPLVMGAISGNALSAMVRDVIPFLFLMMPVLYAGLLQGQNQKQLIRAILLIGILFSVRCVFPNNVLGESTKLDYLANMPSVLMAAIFFAGSAIFNLCARFDVKAVWQAPVFLGLSALCFWPVLETLQRASTGMYGLCVLGVFAFCFMRFPKRAIIVCIVAAAFFIVSQAHLSGALDALARKNMLVGSNMRLEEWAAVWDFIRHDPFHLAFGQGWGAAYASPAVAGITVNYTHSLLSALILKTGLVGLGLGVVYLVALFRGVIGGFSRAPVLALALAGPLVIDIFLYASYKSLDFGLVLMLAAGMGFYRSEDASAIASELRVLY